MNSRFADMLINVSFTFQNMNDIIMKNVKEAIMSNIVILDGFAENPGDLSWNWLGFLTVANHIK